MDEEKIKEIFRLGAGACTETIDINTGECGNTEKWEQLMAEAVEKYGKKERLGVNFNGLRMNAITAMETLTQNLSGNIEALKDVVDMEDLTDDMNNLITSVWAFTCVRVPSVENFDFLLEDEKPTWFNDEDEDAEQ